MTVKAFVKDCKNYSWNEVRIIDTETGEFTHYNTSKSIGFPFGNPYTTTVFQMGYKSVDECLKSLKKNNYLGDEIGYKEQKESERIGYIKLGMERIKRAGRVNTTDFEDICNKLNKYGMGFCDAQNSIIECHLQCIN